MPENYIPAEQDILFLLNQVVKWNRLFRLPAYSHGDPELGAAVIAEGARFAGELLSSLNQLGDEQGCRLIEDKVEVPEAFRNAFRQLAEGGWLGLDLPEQYGGQALPLTLATAFSEMVNGACLAFGMMPCLSRAAATLLIEHAGSDLKERIVPALISGECGATIVITEPQAGSDVGAIKSYAVEQNDGSYLLTGTKIFITCGDQNYTEQIAHLVLARKKSAEPGTRGLSLFLVPKRDFEQPDLLNNVSVLRLEQKMGLKASPTCVLNFDQAVSYPIGSDGDGLRCLFTMMNLMRLEVAIQGVGIASAATQRAVRYARERQQGGVAGTGIIQHADIRRLLTSMQVYTETMRAMVFEASLNLDLSYHAESDQQRRDNRLLAEFLLPVCKAWISDQAFNVANFGVQVLGGHGFVSDDGMEQYVRDCRVLSIYEGTNGIQALDLVMRKLLQRDGSGYALLVKRIEDDLQLYSGNNALASLSASLTEALTRLKSCTNCLLQASRDSLRDVEAAATPYLYLVGHVTGAWMWLRMAAAAAENGSRELGRQKYLSAQFYMEYLLPESQLFERRIHLGAGPIDQCADQIFGCQE